MDQHFFHTRKFKWIVGSIIAVILLMGAFHAGMIEGYRHAAFTAHWNDNYERNFFVRSPIKNHGTIGTVVTIDKDSFVVTDKQSGNEESIKVASSTIIRKSADSIQLSELKTGNTVAVFGSPNEQGQIEARLIRILQ